MNPRFPTLSQTAIAPFPWTTLFVIAACGAFSPKAAAQSSVVLWGVADSAVRHVSNEGRGSVKSLVSGSNSTSRLSSRGTEDLGGGLSAGFHLEHGILLDTGATASSTQFWDRRATVSLISRPLGEIRLGRDFVPSYSNWSRYDPFSYVGVAGSNNFVSATPVGPIRSAYGSGVNTTVRSSNAVQYLLPGGLGGVEGGAMVAAGEGGTAANGQHKVIGARLGYAAAQWGVSAAHTRTENDLTLVGTHQDSAIGAHLSLPVVRLSAAYRQFKYDLAKQRNVLFGVVVPVGSSGEVKASYNRVDLSGRVGATVIDANGATQIGLGYVHSLSKRTALYATGSRIGNKGAATYAVPGGPAGLAGGGSSTGFEAGLRHSF
jgi:predicted porin